LFLLLSLITCGAQDIEVTVLNQGIAIGKPIALKLTGLEGTNQIVMSPQALREVNTQSSTENLNLEIKSETLKDQKVSTMPILVEKPGEFVLKVTITNEKGTKEGNIFILAENNKVTLGRAISDAASHALKGSKTSTWVLGEKYTERLTKATEAWVANREKTLVKAIQNKVPVAIIE